MGPDCGLRPCARCFEYHMDLAKRSLNYETVGEIGVVLA